MIGTPVKTLKEEIIELLLAHPATSKRLRAELKGQGHEITLQGVYKQLNILLESGVILKNKQQYSINNEWVKDVSTMLSIQDIELPEEGEKFTYKFNSLQKLDAQWKHIMSSFRKKHEREAFFSYCPHQIWVYVPSREHSEIKMKNEHEDRKYYNFYTIGGNTDLDTKFKKEFQGKFYRVETYEISGVNRSTHLSIFENIIILTTISKELSNKVDGIYESKDVLSKKETALMELFSENHKCTFVIEHNKKKAYKLKKQISQPFYIPEDIRRKIKQDSL